VELTLNKVNFSGDRIVRSMRATPRVSGDNPVATCGDGWRLQPTNDAASAPMKSVLK
jgi:hypothetical protein